MTFCKVVTNKGNLLKKRQDYIANLSLLYYLHISLFNFQRLVPKMEPKNGLEPLTY